MNLVIIKKGILSLLFFSFFISFSQKDFQGVAYYESKTTIDMSNFGGGQISEERKKEIAQRMKSMLEKTYILSFNQIESVYKEEEKLDAPGGGGSPWRVMMGSLSSGPQYKNIREQKLLQDQEFFGKQFLISDSLPKINWIMGSETKQIGNYMCFKATAKKTVPDSPGFGRPSNDEEEKKTKEIDLVAWYTLQIPVNQGPGEYWGLPGLILELNADRTTILCSKIILNPTEKIEIKAPSKGKEVTKAAYDEIVIKKTAEMRADFRSRGGRR
ncbi:GLPGLI family protein [Siansivirga zeaxanthinifaciens]|uniref:GLPGLI family protein n=1 Tax=Siansivirga zeaxanthinifaciens TaxID=762954 RepID=UPI0005CC0564|nr:GLPGLI family protein [Siansivirga zeaxanthinifaciens]